MKTLLFAMIFVPFLFGTGMVQKAQCQTKTVFDDFEDGDLFSLCGDRWEVFNDSVDGGRSAILQASDSTSFIVFDDDVKSCVAQFTYQMNDGARYPYVGASVSLPAGNVDLLHSIGLEFWHKGDGFAFIAVHSDLPAYQHHMIVVPKSDVWRRFSFNWNQCIQPHWAVKHEFDVEKLTSFVLIKSMPAGSKGLFSIDNISFVVPDRQMLGNSISQAQKMYSASVEGSAPGQYRPVVRNELAQVIGEATQAFKNMNNGPLVFRNQLNKLLRGMHEFENSRINEADLFENFESQSCGKWGFFNDSLDGGISALTAYSVVETADVSKPEEINESAYCLDVHFELVKNQAGHNPFIGFFINTLEHPERNFLLASRGIEILHKGAAGQLLLGLTTVKDYDDYYVDIPASDKWVKHVFTWGQFKQHGWGESREFDLKLVDEVKIIVNDGKSKKGRILIDEIQLLAPEQTNRTGI